MPTPPPPKPSLAQASAPAPKSVLGQKLIRRCIDEGDSVTFFDIVTDTLFPDELKVYEWVKKFYRKHKQLPSVEVAASNGHSLPEADSPVEYYTKRIHDRAVYNAINTRQDKLASAMADQNMEEAVAVFRDTLSAVSALKNPNNYATIRTISHRVREQYEVAKYTPGLLGITTGYPTLDAQTSGSLPGDLSVIVARPGMGKAQPMDAKIRVPNGWRTMGQMTIGQPVWSVDGKESKVTGVYPQGVRQTYKVTFSDGRQTETCGEHLWSVMYRDWKTPRVLTTHALLSMLQCKRYANRLWIDMPNGEGGEDYKQPIPPYLMGALLGDGGLTQTVGFHNVSSEILNNVSVLLEHGYELVHRGGPDYAIVREGHKGGSMLNVYRDSLTRLGLHNAGSHDKFIPPIYLYGSREQRVELARGLMDTDGWVEKSGTVRLSFVSKRLAEDCVNLFRSLGCWCKVKRKEAGECVSWVLSMRSKTVGDLVTVAYKKCRTVNRAYRVRLNITSVVAARKVECQCISVSHPSKLYVTDDYVVTHNTYLQLKMAHAAWKAKKRVAIITMEMVNDALVRRWIGVDAKLNPDLIRKGELGIHGEKVFLKTIEGYDSQDHAYFMAGNFHKSVASVEEMIIQLDPDKVFIDAGYLLTPADRNGADGQVQLAKQVINELKSLGTSYGKPIDITVQFNRNVRKNAKGASAKGGTRFDLADIGGTDAVGQDADLVLGLREPPMPYRNTHRIVEVMKIREGVAKDFGMRFSFWPMDFDEVPLDSILKITDEDNDEDEIVKGKPEWMLS